MIRNLGRTLLVLLVVSASGCRRERGHSKAFDDASALFRKVYAEKLDDAYDDPRMQEVERLLAVVPQVSIDYPAAQELQQRIAAGREALKAQAEAPPQEQAPQADPWAHDPEPPPPPPAAPHPDIGMTVEELKGRFSDCFSFKQSGTLPDKTRHDIWGMEDREACRKAHPGLAGQLLVIDEPGKAVMGFVPATAMEIHYYYPDGGEAPPPQPKP